MKGIRKRHPVLYRILAGALIGCGVSAVVLLFFFAGFFVTLENKTRDVRWRFFSDKGEADRRIVIISIDEDSLNFYRDDLGTWPWPREVFGALVGYLCAGGARLVVFDMLFAEPDVGNPGSDEALAAAVAKSGRVVTSAVFRPGPDGEQETYEMLAKRLFLAEHFSLDVDNESAIVCTDYGSATLPYIGLLTCSVRTGCINFVADSDGPTRSSFPLFRYRGAYYPSLSLAAAAEYLGVDLGREEVVVSEGRHLTVGPIDIPLSADGTMMVNWHGPYRTYRYYSIGDVIESMVAIRRGEAPRIDPGVFSDKIVLVGTTAVSLFDLRATPFSPIYPGVELNATTIDNILNDDHARGVPRPVTLAVILFLSLVVAIVSVRIRSAAAGIVTLLSVLLLFHAAVALSFVLGRIMVEYVAPTSAILLSFVSSLVFNYVTEGRAKRRFKEAFAKYVSADVAEEISAEIDDLSLDVGERRDISILFSDIRGFTAMSERLAPEEVVRRLNVYFEAMVDVVFKYGGTVDKYIGDCIMAFFGAPRHDPDHARKACLCALGMKERLLDVNRRMAEEGIAPMQIGIGVNSGEVVIGNIGSERRMDYTVVGDNVNLAARLEGLNKKFGTAIIISEFTQKRVSGLVVRDLGEVAIKGKERPVRIYELVGEGDGGGAALR
jgi:adenylate cyclase